MEHESVIGFDISPEPQIIDLSPEPHIIGLVQEPQIIDLSPEPIHITSLYVLTTTAKLSWLDLTGVYVKHHEQNPEIVFVDHHREAIHTIPYSSEVWKQILVQLSGILRKLVHKSTWTLGPQVLEGFGPSSIWRNAGIILHDHTRICVKAPYDHTTHETRLIFYDEISACKDDDEISACKDDDDSDKGSVYSLAYF